MSQVNGNNVYPEMIVVAIPNTDRTRDLTPTHVVNDPPMMDSAGAVSRAVIAPEFYFRIGGAFSL